MFVHDSNGDAVTELVDGGFTKRIRKDGGAWGAMTVTITEQENGWYGVPISASHSDTLGVLTITFIHGSAKQVNLQFRVEAKLVADLNDVAATDIVSAGAITTLTGAVVNVDLVDTTTTNTDMVGTDSAALASVCTEGRLAELDAANLPADVDAILVDTAEIGAAGIGLSNIGTIATVTNITNEVTADAVKISGSSAAADKLEESAETIVLGTAATGTLSTTEMTTDLTISVNDQYNGRIIIFRSDTTTAALRGQATDITDTVTINGKLTFTALTTAPANGDTFVIV